MTFFRNDEQLIEVIDKPICGASFVDKVLVFGMPDTALETALMSIAKYSFD